MTSFGGIPHLLLGGMEEKNEKENEKDTQQRSREQRGVYSDVLSMMGPHLRLFRHSEHLD